MGRRDTRLTAGHMAAAILIAACTASPEPAAADRRFAEPAIPGAAKDTVVLGRDLDDDGDPDEVEINLEVVEIREEVYPGKVLTFWVFAPEGRGMVSPARYPSPTIRVEEGDRLRIRLNNTHYFPHTIHFHGTIHPNSADGVPEFTQEAVRPGDDFVYEFIARNPGTHFYHCHVQPDVHVLMGLQGMFIIEPNRPANVFRHLIVGAGEIEDLAKAQAERYDREYSLVYTDVDDRLNDLSTRIDDPRVIEKRMHREYDTTRRQPNIFMLNGRSFPFTLKDTLIRVRSDELVKLRILNAGSRTVSLHTHGHHPVLTHVDGYPVPTGARITRDVFTIGAAQRIDLELRTTPDGYHSSGPGVWLMHDHFERAVTNKGISPGGDITVIAYESFVEPGGLPKVATSLAHFFDPDYYRGDVPVFDPAIFHSSLEGYESPRPRASGHDQHAHAGSGNPGETLPDAAHEKARPMTTLEETLAGHEVMARSCTEPRGFRRIRIEGGSELAREGHVFGFHPNAIELDRCQEVEVVFQNQDRVRHALMIPGLNPMFMLEFRGPGERSARFVTPDEDVTLEFHCHVPMHEEMGMHGVLVIGQGSDGQHDRASRAGERFHGVGEIIMVDRRTGQIVVDHEEIPGFMAAMVMGFAVDPPELLRGLQPGERIRFDIDADRQAIVDIARLTIRGAGTVVSLDAEGANVGLAHGEIPGFADGRTSVFPVEAATLLRDLRVGDEVRFDIDAESESIVGITRRE